MDRSGFGITRTNGLNRSRSPARTRKSGKSIAVNPGAEAYCIQWPDPPYRQMLSLYIHRCSSSESILSHPIRRIIAIVGRPSFALTFIVSRSFFSSRRFTVRCEIYPSLPRTPLAALRLLSRLLVHPVFLPSFSILCARFALPRFVSMHIFRSMRNSVGNVNARVLAFYRKFLRVQRQSNM